MNMQFLLENGVHIVMAIIVLIIFHFIGKGAETAILKKNTMNDKKPSVVIVTLGHIIYYVTFFIGFIIILRIFGVEIASIIAIISAVGFAVGLSLQGALGDIASGILLTFFKIYEIGDVIEINGTEGKVLDFKLIHTVLEELNTKTITVVPNRKMQESIVSNLTKQGYHYFVVRMLVSNKNKDFDKIRSILRTNLKDSKRFPDILQNMPHRISIYDMNTVGTIVQIRVPVTTDGDIAVKRGDIRNVIRVVLEENNVILLDPSAVAQTV
jgi:small conductance mechanosensitive channel